MELLDRCARPLRAALVRGPVRLWLPWGLLGLMLGGSLVKALAPLPGSYMSSKRNLLNVYFVKFAWAWTFWLMLPFIAITNYCLSQNILRMLQRLSTLFVGTMVWYICTSFFSYIEDFSGSCYKSPALDVVFWEHISKRQCHQAGGFWHGFDISGHSFLLSYCALMIMEEIAVLRVLNTGGNLRLHAVVNALFVALSFLTLIWVWMFFCTAIYFHDFSQKFFGTLVGLSAWYGTYRFWYLKSISPGLPLQNISLSSKKPNCSR